MSFFLIFMLAMDCPIFATDEAHEAKSNEPGVIEIKPKRKNARRFGENVVITDPKI